MFEILIVWLYIMFCTCPLGLYLLHTRRNTQTTYHLHDLGLASALGMILIAVFLGFTSLYIPTGHFALHLIVSMTSLAILWKLRKSVQLAKPTFSVLAWIALTTLILGILVKASGPISNPDSGSYHLPFIKWLESYPVVKGLGNVHTRFGFNYQYHNLAAFFGMHRFKGTTLHALNGYCMLILLLFLIRASTPAMTTNGKIRYWAQLICAFFYINMGNAVASFSPDFPAAAMASIALFQYISTVWLNRDETDEFSNRLSITILSLGAFLFKISYAPILLLNMDFLFLLWRRKEWVKLTQIGGIAILFTLPFLLRNYYISGYLIYPLHGIDLFSPDWKIPLTRAIHEKEVIFYNAIGLPAYVPLSFMQKLKHWWAYISIVNSMYRYIIMIAVFAFILSLINLVKIFQTSKSISIKLFIFTLYLSLAYWIFNAPDPRFASGYLYPFIGFHLAFFVLSYPSELPGFLHKIYFIAVSFISLNMLFGKSLAVVKNNFNKTEYYFVHQAPYPKGQIDSQTVRRIKIYQTIDYCWDCPPPCSYTTDLYALRGSELLDGFKPITAK